VTVEGCDRPQGGSRLQVIREQGGLWIQSLAPITTVPEARQKFGTFLKQVSIGLGA